MRTFLLVVPALLFAGAAAAQSAGRTDALDPKAKVPPVEFRSAFEGYRPFAEQDLRDWRKSNDEVGAAGGHVGDRPGQGAAGRADKPPPDKDARPGHGGHK